jgi:hypothetical protein
MLITLSLVLGPDPSGIGDLLPTASAIALQIPESAMLLAFGAAFLLLAHHARRPAAAAAPAPRRVPSLTLSAGLRPAKVAAK